MNTQVPNDPSKPHGCRDCSLSFPTRIALRKHCDNTRHGFICTSRGCNKTFLSSNALTTHLASPAHVRPVVATTAASALRVDTVAAPTQIGLRQPSGRLFPCTVPGCPKILKTYRSRAQHLEMASHGRRPTVSATQTVSRTIAQPRQRSENVTLNHGQEIRPGRLENTPIVNTDHSRINSSAPVLQSTSNEKRPKKPVNAPKPARSASSHITNPPARKPLYLWDTRWSKIPAAQQELSMDALRAAVPSPASWCLTGVDKAFWTPDHKVAPLQDPSNPKRQAIVLDCEMVGVGLKGSTSELARLSAIDFLTGELLIDTLVEPVCPVTDMRTKYSGITAEAMKAAVASGDILKGSTAARTELFKHMDSQTILAGHSLQYDLEALGIRHGVTVDSATLAEAAVGKSVKRRWGLKTLCSELIGITIQDNGKDGHDSVEDALAAREVVLWCLNHRAELKAWGAKKRKLHYSTQKESKTRGKPTKFPVLPKIYYEDVYNDDSDDYDDDSDGYEFRNLSTRELNEMCHYPKWYDNWD